MIPADKARELTLTKEAAYEKKYNRISDQVALLIEAAAKCGYDYVHLEFMYYETQDFQLFCKDKFEDLGYKVIIERDMKFKYVLDWEINTEIN